MSHVMHSDEYLRVAGWAAFPPRVLCSIAAFSIFQNERMRRSHTQLVTKRRKNWAEHSIFVKRRFSEKRLQQGSSRETAADARLGGGAGEGPEVAGVTAAPPPAATNVEVQDLLRDMAGAPAAAASLGGRRGARRGAAALHPRDVCRWLLPRQRRRHHCRRHPPKGTSVGATAPSGTLPPVVSPSSRRARFHVGSAQKSIPTSAAPVGGGKERRERSVDGDACDRRRRWRDCRQ